jgi:hypothetical protein
MKRACWLKHLARKTTKSVPNADETKAVDDSDGGDWDNIDWEDAVDEEDDADNEQCEESLPSFPQEGITIHIGRRVGKTNNPDDDEQREEQKSEEAVQDKPQRKHRKSTVRVLRNVSPETQQLVLDIRRAHMLCCMIHSASNVINYIIFKCIQETKLVRNLLSF